MSMHIGTITICYSTKINGAYFTCENDEEWQTEQAQSQLDEGRSIVVDVMDDYCDDNCRMQITKDAASQKIIKALYRHFPEHDVEVIFDDLTT